MKRAATNDEGLRDERDPFKEFNRELSLNREFLQREFPLPVIDETYGGSEKVDQVEARAIREMYYEGTIEEVIAIEFNLDEETVSRVLNGEIWPYAGGPLRPLALNGANLKNGYTANQRKFIRGIIGLAARLLSPEHFTVFCEFNGFRVNEGREIAHNLENLNARLTKQRFRGVLRLHSAGASLEQCLVARRKKARNPSGGDAAE